jgi:hypothetical protein
VVAVAADHAAANLATPVAQAHMWLKLCAAPTLADANILFAQAELLQHHQPALAALETTVM